MKKKMRGRVVRYEQAHRGVPKLYAGVGEEWIPKIVDRVASQDVVQGVRHKQEVLVGKNMFGRLVWSTLREGDTMKDRHFLPAKRYARVYAAGEHEPKTRKILVGRKMAMASVGRPRKRLEREHLEGLGLLQDYRSAWDRRDRQRRRRYWRRKYRRQQRESEFVDYRAWKRRRRQCERARNFYEYGTRRRVEGEVSIEITERRMGCKEGFVQVPVSTKNKKSTWDKDYAQETEKQGSSRKVVAAQALHKNINSLSCSLDCSLVVQKEKSSGVIVEELFSRGMEARTDVYEQKQRSFSRGTETETGAGNEEIARQPFIGKPGTLVIWKERQWSVMSQEEGRVYSYCVDAKRARGRYREEVRWRFCRPKQQYLLAKFAVQIAPRNTPQRKESGAVKNRRCRGVWTLAGGMGERNMRFQSDAIYSKMGDALVEKKFLYTKERQHQHVQQWLIFMDERVKFSSHLALSVAFMVGGYYQMDRWMSHSICQKKKKKKKDVLQGRRQCYTLRVEGEGGLVDTALPRIIKDKISRAEFVRRSSMKQEIKKPIVFRESIDTLLAQSHRKKRRFVQLRLLGRIIRMGVPKKKNDCVETWQRG